MSLDKFDNILINIITLTAYFVIQIRTIERRFIFACIRHTQYLLDIFAHLLRGCCRQCYDGCTTYHIHYGTDTAIFRTEVVSPFRNTVCLVNGIEGNLHIFEELYIFVLGQRFRSHIQQFGLPAENIRLNLFYSRLIQ